MQLAILDTKYYRWNTIYIAGEGPGLRTTFVIKQIPPECWNPDSATASQAPSQETQQASGEEVFLSDPPFHAGPSGSGIGREVDVSAPAGADHEEKELCFVVHGGAAVGDMTTYGDTYLLRIKRRRIQGSADQGSAPQVRKVWGLQLEHNAHWVLHEQYAITAMWEKPMESEVEQGPRLGHCVSVLKLSREEGGPVLLAHGGSDDQFIFGHSIVLPLTNLRSSSWQMAAIGGQAPPPMMKCSMVALSDNTVLLGGGGHGDGSPNTRYYVGKLTSTWNERLQRRRYVLMWDTPFIQSKLPSGPNLLMERYEDGIMILPANSEEQEDVTYLPMYNLRVSLLSRPSRDSGEEEGEPNTVWLGYAEKWLALPPPAFPPFSVRVPPSTVYPDMLAMLVSSQGKATPSTPAGDFDDGDGDEEQKGDEKSIGVRLPENSLFEAPKPAPFKWVECPDKAVQVEKSLMSSPRLHSETSSSAQSQPDVTFILHEPKDGASAGGVQVETMEKRSPESDSTSVIKAHRWLLMARSTHFRAMLGGEMIESREPTVRCLWFPIITVIRLSRNIPRSTFTTSPVLVLLQCWNSCILTL